MDIDTMIADAEAGLRALQAGRPDEGRAIEGKGAEFNRPRAPNLEEHIDELRARKTVDVMSGFSGAWL